MKHRLLQPALPWQTPTEAARTYTRRHNKLIANFEKNKCHFSTNLDERPGKRSNRIPIRTFPGTFVNFFRKVACVFLSVDSARKFYFDRDFTLDFEELVKNGLRQMVPMTFLL